MAVSLVTDIVMDVMKAAEPSLAEAARAKLQYAPGSAPASEPFAAHMAGNISSTPGKTNDAEAYKKFESLVLGSFIQTMLPDDTESVYGDSMSGDMWKSILAQHLGDAVAEHGGIGIASRLLADHYREGKAVMPLVGVNDSQANAELNKQNALSTALVQEFQRKISQQLAVDASGVTGKAAE